MPTDTANTKRSRPDSRRPDPQPAERPKRKRTRYRSPQRRLVVGLIQFSLVAYASVLVVLIVMETRLVYPAAFMDSDRAAAGRTASIVPTVSAAGPSRQELDAAPTQPDATADLGPTSTGTLRIETVHYNSTNGLTLQGRLLERGEGKEIVLFFHGNGVKAAWLDNWLTELSQRLDANVMAAEYRGFDDDATPTEKGVVADSLAARDYLCERYQVAPTDLILFGNSLGGGCAVAVASQGGAKALILDRTFDRMVDVAANLYPFVPVRWLMRNRYDSLARMTVYHGPLISIHGTTDELIPIEHGRRLYDTCRSERKHWIEVEGLGHMERLPTQTLAELAKTLRQFTGNDRPGSDESLSPEAADPGGNRERPPIPSWPTS